MFRLRRGSEVEVEAGWFTGRTDLQKNSVKRAISGDLAKTLNVHAPDIAVNIIDGDPKGWIIRKEPQVGNLQSGFASAEVPIVIVSTKQVPDELKQQSATAQIIRALVAHGNARGEDVELCPGYGQLGSDSSSDVKVNIGWFTGRSDDQKRFVKKRIVDDLATILRVHHLDIEVSINDGNPDNWAVKGELPKSRS